MKCGVCGGGGVVCVGGGCDGGGECVVFVVCVGGGVGGEGVGCVVCVGGSAGGVAVAGVGVGVCVSAGAGVASCHVVSIFAQHINMPRPPLLSGHRLCLCYYYCICVHTDTHALVVYIPGYIT